MIDGAMVRQYIINIYSALIKAIYNQNKKAIYLKIGCRFFRCQYYNFYSLFILDGEYIDTLFVFIGYCLWVIETSLYIHFCENLIQFCLIHLSQMFHFYTYWKSWKSSGFPTILRGVDIEHQAERVKIEDCLILKLEAFHD